MPEASATVLVRQPLTTVWEYCLIPEHVAALTPGVIGVETVTDGRSRSGPSGAAR